MYVGPDVTHMYHGAGFVWYLLVHSHPHHHQIRLWFDFSYLLNTMTLQGRHNGHDGVSNHQPYHCLLNRLFMRRSKKTSKLRVTGLCEVNSSHKGPVTRKMFPFDDVIMMIVYGTKTNVQCFLIYEAPAVNKCRVSTHVRPPANFWSNTNRGT